MSPPIRVFAFAGVLVAVGLAAFMFLLGRGGAETGSTPVETFSRTTETKPSTSSPTPATRPRARSQAVVTKSGFPLPVDRALRRNPVVVVVVYMPRASVDSIVRREARAAAQASHAGFVQMSALSERLVRPLVANTGVLPDPAVVVVKRPGVVTATLSVTDRATVAQAVAQARR